METNPLERLYGVFVKPQTYLNILYLLLAFPLGIAYFVFLVTGFSLGISLLILWVGLLDSCRCHGVVLASDPV